MDYFHNELRSAFELTHLFENYALSLPGLKNFFYKITEILFLQIESTDLRAIAEVNSFNFFKCTIQYGPNFAFNVCYLSFQIHECVFFSSNRLQ